MLRIALCDFNHSTIGIHTETMPLAIGLLGSYVKNLYGSDVDVRLYKFPGDFMEETKVWQPDLLGLSLYSWNTQLNLHISAQTKKKLPGLCIVAGGPNIPLRDADIVQFFTESPFIDLLVNKDGEIPFVRIIEKLLAGTEVAELKHLLLPSTIAYDFAAQKILKAPLSEKLKSLSDVPSPYLNGMMDKFFQYKEQTLAPFIETNRGCPFSCTFCHSADKYYNKIQWTSLERLEQEMEKFGSHFQSRHDVRLFLADNNFGSFKQDYEFAKVIRKIQDKYNWPRYIDVTTGKTMPDSILKTSNELKWGLTTTSSLQTLTETVLKNISRKNLPFQDYLRLQAKSKEQGGFTNTELILSMPGESKATFLETINRVIENGVETMTIYSLMNLRGTPLYDYHREKPDVHMTRYRIVPRQFGTYEGVRVFDTEEVVVGTPTMPFEDYLYCRGFAYVVQAIYNDSPFIELIQLLKEAGLSICEWLKSVHEALSLGTGLPSQQLRAFLEETKGELWESEAALTEFYSKEENYQKLLRQEIGGNLLSKYMYQARFHGFHEWLEIALSSAQRLLEENQAVKENYDIPALLDDFRVYFKHTRDMQQFFSESTPLEQKSIELTYDIPAWREKRDTAQLLCHLKHHGHYSVFFSEEKKHNIQTIRSQDPRERSVKIQFIIRAHSRDYWAEVTPK